MVIAGDGDGDGRGGQGGEDGDDGQLHFENDEVIEVLCLEDWIVACLLALLMVRWIG